MDLIMDNNPDAPDVIGYRAAAVLLGVPVGTVYAWVSQRRVPFLRLSKRLVRFRRSELLAFLDAHRVAPRSEVV